MKRYDRQRKRALHTDTKAWRLLRQKVLVRDLYRCQACRKLVTGKEAHVDHIDGNDANQDMSNLQLLCAAGHSRKTAQAQRGKAWDGKCSSIRRIGLDGWPVVE